MLAVLLFAIYYICLVHLFAPTPSNQLSRTVEMPNQPIEQQLKEVLWSEPEPETTKTANTAKEIKDKATVSSDLLEGIKVEELNLRQARKVAKALNIRQKVAGKNQPKALLVAQITMKLKTNPTKFAPIIAQQVMAA